MILKEEKMINKIFITVFYSGLFPIAPGTAGSILSTVFAFFILEYLGVETLSLLTILITIIAFKEVDKYQKITKSHDSSEIVIDELIGVWIAIIIAHDNFYVILLSLFYFRLFDIFKPSIIGRIDKIQTSFGVIFDDVLAGLFGGISSAMTYHLLMKVL
jgi:phosphatidylglycerophosphatase A